MRLILLALAFMAAPLFAADAPVYAIPLRDIDGKDISLKTYARYDSKTEPDSAEFTQAIESALAAK
jgi:hypothetical protein